MVRWGEMEPPDRPESPVSRQDAVICALLGTATLVVYLQTVAPSLLEEGDGVELSMVAYLLGVSHPTGYPLFTLLGYAFTHLVPLGTVAARLNVFSSILTAMAAPAIYMLARQLSIARLGSAVAALTFAFSFSVWTVSTRGDVHGLHALLVALASALLIRWARAVDAGRHSAEGWRVARGYLVSCAFICGLGIANHITTYLLAPAFLVYFAWAGRPFWSRPLRLLVPVLAFAAPLLLYAYVPLRGEALLADPLLAQDPAGLGAPLYVTLGLVSPHYLPGGWSGLLNLVFGLSYAPAIAAIPWSEAPARLAALPDLFARQLGPAGLLLAALGYLALLLRRPREGVLFGLVLAAFSLQVTRATEQDMGVFLIPAYLYFSVCVGYAAARIMQALDGIAGARFRRVARHATAGLLLLLPLSQVAGSLPEVDRSGDWSVYNYTERLFASNPPQGAIIMGAGDYVVPIRYRQSIDGLRPDLVALHVGFGTDHFLELVDQAAANGRPVLMVESLPEEERGPDTGRFTAKVSPLPLSGDARPQYAAYTSIAARVALLGYDLPSESAHPGQAFGIRLYWRALQRIDADYEFFVRLISPQGSTAWQVQRTPLSQWYPPSVWQVGATYADDVLLHLPADTPPGLYNLEVGWTLHGELVELVRDGFTEEAPIVLRQVVVGP